MGTLVNFISGACSVLLWAGAFGTAAAAAIMVADSLDTNDIGSGMSAIVFGGAAAVAGYGAWTLWP